MNSSAKVPRCNEQDTVLGTVGNTGSLKCGPYPQDSPTDLRSKDRAEGGDAVGVYSSINLSFHGYTSWNMIFHTGLPRLLSGKESACQCRRYRVIPGWGRPAGGGHGSPLQSSCLENPHVQRSLAGYSPWGWQRVGQDWAHSTFSRYQTPADLGGHNVGVQRIMWMRIQYSHRRHLRGRSNQSTKNLLDSTCLLPKITSMLSDRCEGCKYNLSWIKP